MKTQFPQGSLLYHWTSLSKALTALRTDRLQARRWSYYLEDEDRMAKGSSWSSDPWLWSKNSDVCLVVNPTLLPNRSHALNSSRAYWQTQGMVSIDLYDPNAYKLESTTPDQEFIEGTIIDLSGILVEVRLLSVPDTKTDELAARCITRGVTVTMMHDALDDISRMRLAAEHAQLRASTEHERFTQNSESNPQEHGLPRTGYGCTS